MNAERTTNLKEVYGGVGYHYIKWGAVTAGYRSLHEDGDRDNVDLKLDAHGFLPGFGFHF